ncbi:restriction endonuclease subunit S [Stenotrophomonas maltophilia]|uniref:restriction endonuclease subunit S n=1 Tax=Stenotrophomonas maltophilia TaxID=40324 RepID=UPI00209B24F4|nr:restriction endonuclease subunit S [Stenotrophomonas maltophilia]MCO7498052.1 restriction endonuclease subunit S [Stenotrophomonas maltophilia]
MLPNGWKTTTVGQSCSIRNTLRFPLSAADRAVIQGHYPYFGPTGQLDSIDHYRIDEPFALIGEDGDHFLKFRDRSMTLYFEGKANVNNHAHIIGDSEECLAKWFYYCFMHRDLTPVLSRQGVGRYKLTKAGLEKLELPLPPIREQAAIVGVLSTWDQTIAATERLLANSKQQRLGLMQKLISDRSRQSRGETVLRREHASEIFLPRSVRRNDGLELLSVMQDVGVVPRSSLDRKVVMPDGSTDGYKLVEPGDFVISLRSFEGGLEYSRYRGLVSPAYTVLMPTKPIVDDFYRHYFKSQEFIGRLAVAVIGIRDGKQISYNDFEFIKLPYPSIEEQEAIAITLNAAEQVVKRHETYLQLLRQEKAALMSQLLTGKRRVKLQDIETEVQA